MLKDNLKLVHQRIHMACERCGRDPSAVTLVCVTKGISPDVIREAAALGITDIGENRVQEARAKQLALGSRRFRIAPACHDERGVGRDFGLRIEAMEKQSEIRNSQSAMIPLSYEGIRWHLVGHLQRNKAKFAVELFDVIHSVDSVELAQELDRQAAKRAPGSRLPGPPVKSRAGAGQAPGSLQPGTYSLEPLEVFIQVNVSGEATKFGCSPDDAPALARTVIQLPNLRLRGLMTLAPLTEEPEQARPHFRRLRELRDELSVALNLEPRPPQRSHSAGRGTLNLSMGMSGDFEVAIEEGADLVRIGTAIFGEGLRRQNFSS